MNAPASAVGSFVAVPLRKAGFGIGVVSRLGRSRIGLGYFFGLRLSETPDLRQLPELRAENAVLVARFGDLGLRERRWLVIGSVPHWDPKEWPVPGFRREQSLTGEFFEVRYSDEDPNDIVSETPRVEAEVANMPPDRLLTAGAVEVLLTRLT
jgi:hypothetical protein